MVRKSKKMECGGGLGTSGGRLGNLLEPRWHPRAPEEASRGARMANLAPRWATTWLENEIPCSRNLPKKKLFLLEQIICHLGPSWKVLYAKSALMGPSFGASWTAFGTLFGNRPGVLSSCPKKPTRGRELYLFEMPFGPQKS